MSDKKEQEEIEDHEPRLYELGYHLLPTIVEESLGGEVSKIKDIIDSHGGLFSSEEMPHRINLTYKMPKILSNKKRFYDTAYFGWMRFNLAPNKAVLLKGDLDKNESILRFIIFKTIPEKPISPRKMTFFGTRRKPLSTKKESPLRHPLRSLVGGGKKKEEGKQMTEEELDKTIEELVVE